MKKHPKPNCPEKQNTEHSISINTKCQVQNLLTNIRCVPLPLASTANPKSSNHNNNVHRAEMNRKLSSTMRLLNKATASDNVLESGHECSP